MQITSSQYSDAGLIVVTFAGFLGVFFLAIPIKAAFSGFAWIIVALWVFGIALQITAYRLKRSHQKSDSSHSSMSQHWEPEMWIRFNVEPRRKKHHRCMRLTLRDRSNIHGSWSRAKWRNGQTDLVMNKKICRHTNLRVGTLFYVASPRRRGYDGRGARGSHSGIPWSCRRRRRWSAVASNTSSSVGILSGEGRPGKLARASAMKRDSTAALP